MNRARRNAVRKRRNQKRFFVCPTLHLEWWASRSSLTATSRDWRMRRHTGLSYWTVGGIIHPMTAWALGRGPRRMA